MSIVKKKIGKNEYAYLVTREGKRVVHKYLGSAQSPRVKSLISQKNEVLSVPERFRSLFWDTSLDNIHLMKNARYVIERVMEYGNMDSVDWLQRVYPVQKIIDVIKLSRTVTEKSKNFWMIWFGATDV